jgi:hypothetical protein
MVLFIVPSLQLSVDSASLQSLQNQIHLLGQSQFDSNLLKIDLLLNSKTDLNLAGRLQVEVNVILRRDHSPIYFGSSLGQFAGLAGEMTSVYFDISDVNLQNTAIDVILGEIFILENSLIDDFHSSVNRTLNILFDLINLENSENLSVRLTFMLDEFFQITFQNSVSSGKLSFDFSLHIVHFAKEITKQVTKHLEFSEAGQMFSVEFDGSDFILESNARIQANVKFLESLAQWPIQENLGANRVNNGNSQEKILRSVTVEENKTDFDLEFMLFSSVNEIIRRTVPYNFVLYFIFVFVSNFRSLLLFKIY